MYERVKPTLQSGSVNLKHSDPDIWGYIWGYAKNHAIKKRND
jgi:hypothetical protein